MLQIKSSSLLLIILGIFSLGSCELFLNLSEEVLVENTLERCLDNVDNDGDSQVDCEDIDCSPFCQLCGNGIIDKDEDCDDGNPLDADGCNSLCSIPLCDNGVVERGEICLDNLPSVLKSGAKPVFVNLSDLNNDQLIDILVTNEGSSSLSLFFNLGDGQFSEDPNLTLLTGESPSSAAVGDFNQDGFPDIAVANQKAFVGAEIDIFLNAATGFTSDHTSISGGEEAVSLLTEDVSGDGKLDLIFAKTASSFIGVLLGDGNGSFSEPFFFLVGNKPSSIATGDFNQDGLIDLAVTSLIDNSVDILLRKNDDTDTLFNENGPDLTISLGSNAALLSVVSADVNQDGFLDLMIADRLQNGTHILAGSGNGSFAPPVFMGAKTLEPRFLATADFDLDGISDLLSVQGAGKAFEIYSSQGVGILEEPLFSFAPIDGIGTSAAAADLNNDGALDVVTSFRNPADISVHLANP